MLSDIILIIILSGLGFFFLRNFAFKIKLLDFPNNRKIHKKPIPLIGGIVIGGIMILAVLLFDFKNSQYNMILNFSLFIVIVGFLDDLKNLSATNKLILQSIPIFFLVFNYNFFITDLGEYQYLGTINLGTFAPIFTLLCIFLFINACNYLDGIDGSLSIIYLNSVMILFLITENKNIDINYFYITITFPVIIFLFFNLIPFFPKIFLGDSGSLLLGYLLSCLMIISNIIFQVHPILVAWSVNLIVFDFLFVNIKRIILNRNILIPSLDHIHHLCFLHTKSITFSNIILISVNSFFAGIGIFLLNYFNSLISLIAYFISFLLYILIRNKLISNKE